MIVVSFDPGTTSGIAVFYDDRLTFAAHGKSVDTLTLRAFGHIAEECDDPEEDGFQIVSEYPKIYPTGKGKGDPNGLLKVAQYAGEFFACMRLRQSLRYWDCDDLDVTKYFPQQWKGSVPKEISQARIRQILDTDERVHFDATNSDGRDAIGIGLYHIGRGYKCK